MSKFIEKNDTKETGKFKMDSIDFAIKILKLHGKYAMCILLCLAIGGISLGISLDYRYFILSLIIIFIITPGALAILYYNYGFKKGFCFNLSNHSLMINEQGAVLNIYYNDELIRKMIIPFSNIKEYYVGKDCVTYILSDDWDGILWIPLSSTENEEEYIELIQNINAHIKK